MGTIASEITSLTIVYTTVYSDADQSKHQSSASLAFVWGIHRDRWIPRTKDQLRGNVSIWWRHHENRPKGGMCQLHALQNIDVFTMCLICTNSKQRNSLICLYNNVFYVYYVWHVVNKIYFTSQSFVFITYTRMTPRDTFEWFHRTPQWSQCAQLIG